MAAAESPYVGIKQSLFLENHCKRIKARALPLSIIGLITIVATVFLALMIHSARTGCQFRGNWSWLHEGAARLTLEGIVGVLVGTLLVAAMMIKIAWPASYGDEFYKKISKARRESAVSTDTTVFHTHDFFEMDKEDFIKLNPNKIRKQLKDNEQLVILLTENGKYEQFVRFTKDCEHRSQPNESADAKAPSKGALVDSIMLNLQTIGRVPPTLTWVFADVPPQNLAPRKCFCC